MLIGSECEQALRRHEFDNNKGRLNLDVADLISAILREQSQRKLDVSYDVGRMALIELSDTTLGALEGCIARSLLAPFCEARVDHIEREARQHSLEKIMLQEAKSDTEMNAVWCLADRAFKADR